MKYLLTLITISLFCSCSPFVERKENVTCTFSGGGYGLLSFSIDGYTREETDTVIINWYKEGGSFSELIGSATYTLSDSFYPEMSNKMYPRISHNDSLKYTYYTAGLFKLSQSDPFKGYDAEVLLPGAGNARHTIQNIIVEGNVTERKSISSGEKGYCYRNVVSYTADGNNVKNISNANVVSFTK